MSELIHHTLLSHYKAKQNLKESKNNKVESIVRQALNKKYN